MEKMKNHMAVPPSNPCHPVVKPRRAKHIWRSLKLHSLNAYKDGWELRISQSKISSLPPSGGLQCRLFVTQDSNSTTGSVYTLHVEQSLRELPI